MNGNHASFNKVFNRSSTGGYATISSEQMLKDHPYASLYAPTLLPVQERLKEEPQPQPVQTPSLNYDSVNTNHQNAVRQDIQRELPQPMETPSLEVLHQNASLKTEEIPVRQNVQRELPQPMETPSLEVRQSRIRKLQRLLATPSESEENMSTRNDSINVRHSTMDIGDTSRNMGSSKRMKGTSNRPTHLSLPPNHASKNINSNSFDKAAFVRSTSTHSSPIDQQSLPQTKSQRSFKSASNASNCNDQSAMKPDAVKALAMHSVHKPSSPSFSTTGENIKSKPKPQSSSSDDDAQWMRFFEQLVTYKATHETPFVPRGDKTYPELARWVQVQIYNYQTSKMKEEHEHLLCSIGFDFHEARKRSNGTWEAMYQRYQAYLKNNDSVVIFRVAAVDPELSNWMKNQRSLNKKQIIAADRKKRLDDLGFDWTIRHWDSWQEMFSKLTAFREKHGHVDVKRCKGEDHKLANWVRTQRQRLQNQLIPKDQVELLDSIGFDWRTKYILCENEQDQGDSNSPGNSPNAPKTCSKPKYYPTWDAMYDRYRQYAMNHDHVVACVVTASDPKLANWIKNQRASFNKGMMKKDRKLRLDAVGFDFVVQKSKLWKRMYKNLACFHYKHGHLNVPVDSGNIKLIKWMDVQRKRRLNDTIVDEEVRSLDQLGFDWQLKE